ncbi:MAG: hypothetical protein IKH99_04485 [Prevotella sp.]|nr:hypothetical protein [Prevotella sp.]
MRFHNMNRLRIGLFLSVLLAAITASAQDRDKVSADTLLYEQLCAQHVTENYHAPYTINKRDLEATAERGIYIVNGKSFQVKSLTSDFYVREKKGTYEPIFDKRYPVESFTNILLNRLKQNKLKIAITQHLYGKTKKVPTQSMQNIYDLLARNMDIYCSVTSITKEKMEATLVFHHRKLNFIHLFIVSVPTDDLFDEGGLVTATLYGNIPQSNIRTLFGKYKE